MVVANGTPLPAVPALPGEVTVLELEDNRGCPGGRNAGIARLRFPVPAAGTR